MSARLRLVSIDVLAQNPLDVFARLALAENYDRERISDTELHLGLPGEFCDHHVTMSWSPEDTLLQMFLVFDFRPPQARQTDICKLITLLNARLTVGHFDYWESDNAIIYRQSFSLSGGARLNTDQAMTMLAAAQDCAEKAYPACQYFLWADKTPHDAIDCALYDQAIKANSFRQRPQARP